MVVYLDILRCTLLEVYVIHVHTLLCYRHIRLFLVIALYTLHFNAASKPPHLRLLCRNIMSERKVVRIGTRESKLAMWQAEFVKSVMSKAHPEVDFVIVGMTTMGDKDQLKPLSSFDSKGVFTKELDNALENNLIDVAVHCMKDLATLLPYDQKFFATIDRGIVEDAVILHPKYHEKFSALIEKSPESKTSIALDMLPQGAVVGTSALRRQVRTYACISRQRLYISSDIMRISRVKTIITMLLFRLIIALIQFPSLSPGYRISLPSPPHLQGYPR